MNLHFHVSIDDVSICLKVQPQVIPVDENTPTSSCIYAEQCSVTENPVPNVSMFQKPNAAV